MATKTAKTTAKPRNPYPPILPQGHYGSLHAAMAATKGAHSIYANWGQSGDNVWAYRDGRDVDMGTVASWRHDPHAAARSAYGPNKRYYVVHKTYSDDVETWQGHGYGYVRTGGWTWWVDGPFETE